MRRTRRDAYSDMQMAEKRPTGMATHMAMAVIMKVPAKRGTEPKRCLTLPSPPTVAASGFQTVPVRKSQKLTMRKKWTASKTMDRTMPMVVRMEMSEASRRTRTMVFSRAVLTRSPGLIALRASHMPPAPRARAVAATMGQGTSMRSKRSRNVAAALTRTAGMSILVTANQPNRFSEALKRAFGSCWLRIFLRPRK